MASGPGLFERAAEARARLLRAARVSGAGPPGMALTFDAGLILIELEPGGGGGLAITHTEEGDAPPPGLVPVDEEEPWWRLLGCPLTAAQAAGDCACVREVQLRFRESDDDPRVVTLTSRGGSVAAILEDAGGQDSRKRGGAPSP